MAVVLAERLLVAFLFGAAPLAARGHAGVVAGWSCGWSYTISIAVIIAATFLISSTGLLDLRALSFGFSFWIF